MGHKMKEMQVKWARCTKAYGRTWYQKGEGMTKTEETKRMAEDDGRDVACVLGDMGGKMGGGKMTPRETTEYVKDDGRHVRHDETDVRADGARDEDIEVVELGKRSQPKNILPRFFAKGF